MKDSGYLWLAAALLAVQAALSALRAILMLPNLILETTEGAEPADETHITRLSTTVDYLLVLATGLYFVAGMASGAPQIETALRTWLPDAPAWLAILAQGLFFILLGWLSLGFGALIPEAVGGAAAMRWHERVASFLYVPDTILRPLTGTALGLANVIARRLGAGPVERSASVTEEEIKTLVSAGEHEGFIEEETRAMIYSIFQLDDMITREVMIPRIDVVALDVETGIQEALDIIVSSGHSRIPVFEHTIDNVVGVLHVKDLLHYFDTREAPPSLREILRPAHFVPESKRLDNLLKEMQENNIHQAIVVDEYGGVAGLVTLEDVVEEIVGEIRDEYDHEEPEVTPQSDGTYLFDARIPLDDVQALVDAPFPLDEVDSLGGFIYNELGHIPTPGETLTHEGLTFEVVEVTGRRIRKVRTLPTSPPADADQDKNKAPA
ncbi:MAG: HlyC/CorC family transporter [Anaerolineae bacterium]|nr:HlyC/CorC family transporter [Anaerolineae bacterium]